MYVCVGGTSQKDRDEHTVSYGYSSSPLTLSGCFGFGRSHFFLSAKFKAIFKHVFSSSELAFSHLSKVFFGYFCSGAPLPYWTLKSSALSQYVLDEIVGC